MRHLCVLFCIVSLGWASFLSLSECEHRILFDTTFCHLHPDAITRFDSLVSKHLFAQNEAVDVIRMQLPEFLNPLTDRTGPILTHLSGPSGTGKTTLVNLLAEAVFYSRSRSGGFCGLYQRPLNQYSALPDVINEFEGQLRRCPRSIIFLDDLQHARSDELYLLRPFMQSSQLGNISTSQMWLIVASDFDSAAQKSLPKAGSITSEEMAMRVIALTKEHFADPSSNTNHASSRTTELLRMPIVPMLPFQLDDIVSVAFSILLSNVQKAGQSLRHRLEGRLPQSIEFDTQVHVDQLELRHQLSSIQSQVSQVGMRALSSEEGPFSSKSLKTLDDLLIGTLRAKIHEINDQALRIEFETAINPIKWFVGEHHKSCVEFAKLAPGSFFLCSPSAKMSFS